MKNHRYILLRLLFVAFTNIVRIKHEVVGAQNECCVYRTVNKFSFPRMTDHND